MPEARNTSPEIGDMDRALERIVFFSDAVMAIAITLLTIDLRVPEMTREVAALHLTSELSAMMPQFVSFGISFMLIGIYWMAHLRMFRYIKRYDPGLIVLNLLFLSCIALLPFSSYLVGSYNFLTAPNVLYAGNAAAVGLTISAVWWYASHKHRLIDQRLSPTLIHGVTLSWLAPPMSFLLSIPIAFIDPTSTSVVWWILPAGTTLLARLIARRW
jgi:uncharacterized membrane protein